MEKDMIGTILKDRIKEKGYTQEEFAEKAGIGISSLKKYMNGTTAYSYELLETFAGLLDCSYDYLLGLSKSAKRELRDIREQIEFSDEALEKLIKYSASSEYEADRYMKTLDIMIRSKGLITCIADYLVCSRYLEKTTKLISEVAQECFAGLDGESDVTAETAYMLSVENQVLIALVSELKDAKRLIGVELLEELKKNYPMSEVEVLVDTLREKISAQ